MRSGQHPEQPATRDIKPQDPERDVRIEELEQQLAEAYEMAHAADQQSLIEAKSSVDVTAEVDALCAVVKEQTEELERRFSCIKELELAATARETRALESQAFVKIQNAAAILAAQCANPEAEVSLSHTHTADVHFTDTITHKQSR